MLGNIVALPVWFVLTTTDMISHLPMAALYTSNIYAVVWLIGVYGLLILFLCQRRKTPMLLVTCAILTLLLTHALSWLEPVTDDFRQFCRDYQDLTGRVRETAQPHDLSEGAMVIGTSVLADHEINGAVNIYAGIYNNPFLIWGKYRRGWLKTTLPMSFQFHHTQMDGIPAAEFLVDLQREIDQFNP
jgi:hypothetical protein